ncbi:unnamed protein product [Ilex paraguariensis]|uniref:non-specific serine/threonine protein kinase n=1 Tax=Ilex paraguariensis TaxID=185542 RepID=A0ABC8S7C1_9AQUA
MAMADRKKDIHGKYELGRLVGHGSFAKVYHAKNLQTGESVAIKVVSKDKVIRVGMTEQVKREISVMKKVNHPNIVRIYEVMATKSKIYIAMEYARGGELFTKISKGHLREDVARNYFRQLISAVDFCHSRGVFHRDLKPENLLLDEEGNLKVTDFGLSASSDDSDQSKQDRLFHTACGTPAYVAPEVIGNRGKIHKGKFKCPPWFSPESRRILTRMLDPNPSTRITISKLVETAWFKEGNPRNSKKMNEEDDSPQVEGREATSESETLNAFHIISLSKGFDLSPLFEEKRKEKEELRFGTAKPASSVISRLEEVAKAAEFIVKKCESRVRLEGMDCGRKGKLAVEAEMFEMAPPFMVVEVRKDGGDTLEYNQFFSKELRPALQDIIWTAENSMAA